MKHFTITSQIEAPVEDVWSVLSDFGNIANWSAGTKRSELTSKGDVGQGTTRHCALAPMGGVNERIETYEPNEHLTVKIYDTSKVPISEGLVDFKLSANDGRTDVTVEFSYTPNRLGRMAKGAVDKQMRKGVVDVLSDLATASASTSATTMG